MGDTTHVDDQEQIVRKLLGPGVSIADRHVWKDNSKSAWRRDRSRPDWDAMLAAIERGELNNGELGVYHGDRLARQPRDMEDLIDLGADRALTLVFPTGRYNLADPDHRMMLRWIVSRAVNEIDHMSRRLKDGRRRRWDKGLVRGGGRGGRSFGFETDGITHVAAETAEVQAAAPRVLAGDATNAIVNEWNDGGIRTTAGGLWTHQSWKAMMLRPRYAGLMPDGETVAAWEPVLDRDTWEGVKAVLENRAALFTADTSRARHLLSGIATCGPCSAPVEAGPGPKGPYRYRCPRRGCMKVTRALTYLDAYVVGHVLELLGSKRVIRDLQTPDDPNLARDIAALEARKAEAEEQLANLVDHPNLKPDLLLRSLASFDGRIEEIRDKLTLSARRRLLLQHAGLDEDGWKRQPLHMRRSLVRATYRVVIRPVAKKGPGFEADTIDVVPVED